MPPRHLRSLERIAHRIHDLTSAGSQPRGYAVKSCRRKIPFPTAADDWPAMGAAA